jgi:hypothetical protein
MRKPWDYRNPTPWVSEDDVLESLRGLWDEAMVADAARLWFRAASATTPDARKRAAEALRTVAQICRNAAFRIELGGTSAEDEGRRVDEALATGRRP